MSNTTATDRPNVILICVDQWRGDCLSIAGHPVVRTPHLDDLAAGGARFGRAYTATPSCIAGRAALLTGMAQESHGRVGYQDGLPWPYEHSIAAEFTRGGYQTRAVGKMHVHPVRKNLGFEHIVLHDGYVHYTRHHHKLHDEADDYMPWLRERVGADADYFDHGLNCNAYNARPWDKPEHLHPTNFVVTKSIEFLNQRDTTRPFFLFMSFHRPHPPFDPPAWAFEQYVDAKMPDAPVGDWASHFEPMHEPLRPDLVAGKLTPDRLQRARAGYYGHLTHIDMQINRFMETLNSHNLAGNTYIMFVSDHGDLMGDHHLYRKALPYEGSARVPLLLRGPQGSGIGRDTVCDQAVELRDVMPTLLDCAGLPIPDCVDGKSMLGLARKDEDAAANWRPCFHGEHTFGRLDGKPYNQQVHYLTDGREKYVWFSEDGTEQLFDLVNDPDELHNLAGRAEEADRVSGWRERMVDALCDREEGFVVDGMLTPIDEPLHPTLKHLRDQVPA